MTKGEFLVYLLTHHRLAADSRKYAESDLFLQILTTFPLGYSLYERSWEVATDD